MQGGAGVACPMTWVFFWLIVDQRGHKHLKICPLVSGAHVVDEIPWLHHLQTTDL